MKPASFEYFRCESAPAALELLAQHGDEAKVLAGGQSLVPMMNMRLARPEVIVDISRAEDLTGLDVGEEAIRIQAGVTQLQAERSPELAQALPVAGEALAQLGHVPIRARGTICGSLAHADPAAELPTLMLALDAEMSVASKSGSRTVPAADFFRGYFTTALEPDELLTEVRIERRTDGWGSAFLEVARRHGDFALAGVAALVDVDSDRRIRNLRLAFSSVAEVPVRSAAAEEVLRGQPLDASEAFEEAQTVVASEIDPGSDVHASSEYRREVAGVLLQRAVRLAGERAAGEASGR